MAKFLPAGSALVFQIQYIANGRAAADQSSIELIFSKHAPERRVLTLQLTNDHFVIPPGAPDYRVEARGTLPNDATLFSFFSAHAPARKALRIQPDSQECRSKWRATA